jgi:hypothetical protein
VQNEGLIHASPEIPQNQVMAVAKVLCLPRELIRNSETFPAATGEVSFMHSFTLTKPKFGGEYQNTPWRDGDDLPDWHLLTRWKDRGQPERDWLILPEGPMEIVHRRAAFKFLWMLNTGWQIDHYSFSRRVCTFALALDGGTDEFSLQYVDLVSRDQLARLSFHYPRKQRPQPKPRERTNVLPPPSASALVNRMNSLGFRRPAGVDVAL